MQNFSPRPDDIEQLQKIDYLSRGHHLGNVAQFEDLIPNYANINNTHTDQKEIVPDVLTRPVVTKVRPHTSQLSRMMPKRMFKAA